MSIDNEEVVVEAEEAEETEKETEVEAETKSEGEKKEKTSETLADRKARLERQLAQTNKKLGVDVEKPEPKSSKKSDDLDYGQKAFLNSNGIKGGKEFDFVKKELKASGEELDALLENDYFKSRLEKFRNLNKTSEATPTGKRSGGVATDSVEYWAAKPFEEVPAEMRAKVVNHQLEKEKNKGQFYNS